jgi:hypothetical protein
MTDHFDDVVPFRRQVRWDSCQSGCGFARGHFHRQAGGPAIPRAGIERPVQQALGRERGIRPHLA